MKVLQENSQKLVTMPDEETEDPYEDFRKEPRPIIQEPAEAMVFQVLFKVSCEFKRGLPAVQVPDRDIVPS